ncbi:myelin-oligodendrocyte glycoprotein-like isoform X1 [Esox lucius]|uniref:Ig-like domain-containing protein n=1 Tax=Esox lucius TaxID=8010 RepID=A0AAY5K9B5_ESOLU|nr:myelin-oligodendrocyte glycoprotein-like isoform X1 [Esox lucius]
MKDYRRPVICLLLILLSVCRAQNEVQVVCQSESVVVEGDDAILHCSLRTTVSAVDGVVEWQRPDLQPKKVHFYRNLVDYNDDQNNIYRGRTSLFKEEMKNGNISLKLTGVKLCDAGNYTCFVPTLESQYNKQSVQLIVEKVFPEPIQSSWRSWWFDGPIGGLIVLIVVAVVLYILKNKGLLHWGREVNGDPQRNGTSQNSIPLLNRNAPPNGNQQNGTIPREANNAV